MKGAASDRSFRVMGSDDAGKPACARPRSHSQTSGPSPMHQGSLPWLGSMVRKSAKTLFRVWPQTSLSDQAGLDLRDAGLSSLKCIRVRMHGIGAQIELVRVRDCRTQDEFGIASSLELDRRLRSLEHREVSGAQKLGGNQVPSANGNPAHRLPRLWRIAPTFASPQPDEEIVQR